MENINHAEMVKTLAKPGEDIIASLTPLKAHLWHMASCVMGEVGELTEAIAEEDMMEELGDIEFYLEGIRGPLNIDREKELLPLVPGFDASDLPSKAGLLFDVIKKHVIYNKELDMVSLIKYLNEVESCLASTRADFDFTREQTLEANIAKLSVRYNGLKYSDKAAQERADKAGAQ